MKTKPTHGGYRAGSGKKPSKRGILKARTVKLSDVEVQYFSDTYGGLTAAVHTLLPDPAPAE